MKRISKIARYAKTILPLCCLASCSYLDVVPPETEDIKDMMKNEDARINLEKLKFQNGLGYAFWW